MADIEQKLQLIAERGTRVGPEELIERVEQQLAGHSPVVVRGQRKGRFMTKTDERRSTSTPPARRGLAWAAVVFIAVIALSGLLYLIGAADGPTEPPQTTVVPTTTSDTGAAVDVALFEEAVAAWYSNDFETVSRVLAIPGGADQEEAWTEDQIRRQMEYDSAIGARVEDLTCTTPTQQGNLFTCRYRQLNSLKDASGVSAFLADQEPSNEMEVQVRDGQVVLYAFEDFDTIPISIGMYLATVGEYAGYETCYQPPLDPQCAQIQLDHVDAWVEWNQTTTALDIGEAFVAGVAAGDCVVWGGMSGGPGSFWGGDEDCEAHQTLEGMLEVTDCRLEGQEEEFPFQSFDVFCDGMYSDALSKAVGAPPASGTVGIFVENLDGIVWRVAVLGDRPQHAELLTAVESWARDTDIGDDLVAACGINFRADESPTPACAAFLVENLDAWAAWYRANN